jgi:hypothetical protein
MSCSDRFSAIKFLELLIKDSSLFNFFTVLAPVSISLHCMIQISPSDNLTINFSSSLTIWTNKLERLFCESPSCLL